MRPLDALRASSLVMLVSLLPGAALQMKLLSCMFPLAIMTQIRGLRGRMIAPGAHLTRASCRCVVSSVVHPVSVRRFPFFRTQPLDNFSRYQ